jgi:hypothetical protein
MLEYSQTLCRDYCSCSSYMLSLMICASPRDQLSFKMSQVEVRVVEWMVYEHGCGTQTGEVFKNDDQVCIKMQKLKRCNLGYTLQSYIAWLYFRWATPVYVDTKISNFIEINWSVGAGVQWCRHTSMLIWSDPYYLSFSACFHEGATVCDLSWWNRAISLLH